MQRPRLHRPRFPWVKSLEQFDFDFQPSLDRRQVRELAAFWQLAKEDMAVARLFTLPYEPAYHGDYPAFLSRMGYAPEPACPGWWSKSTSR